MNNTFDNNIGIGLNAGSTGNFSPTISIGNDCACTWANQMQLGNSLMNVYTQNAINTRSDARDKIDIRDTLLGLEFINKLRPVDYKWNCRDDYKQIGKNNDGSLIKKRYHHGLIAQEVQSTIKEIGIDFGGFQDHAINGGNDVLTIGYSEMIGPLIKAIQELTIQNQKINDRIYQLQINNNLI